MAASHEGERSAPAAAAAPSTPKTRLGLSLAERIKVIEARQMGKSMRQLAAQFGCGKTQILNTLAQKERYVREWELMGRNNPSIGARKRFRHTRNEQINRSVHEWYQQQSATGLRVTGPMLQKQARHYAAHLGILNFAASNGWLANFRRFYNICSPHPRKRRTNIPEVIDQRCDTQQPSTSTYHLGAEFVCAGYNQVSKESPRSHSESESSGEKDPLQDVKQSSIYGLRHIKLEPASDDDEQSSIHTHSEENYPVREAMCSIPSQNSTESLSPPTQQDEAPNQNLSVIRPNTGSQAAFVNFRKRRLLQSEVTNEDPTLKNNRPEIAEKPLKAYEDRRLPDLQPLTPSRAFLVEFVNLARSRGMVTLTMRDEAGNEWLEVRPSVATYRVPQYGYPTHLARLVVDASLEYYLEVLGHCVRKGSLVRKETGNAFNYAEAVSVVCSLGGGHVVCSGIETMFYRVSSLHMRTVLEIGQAENMYVTLPDYRYRSNDCLIWIDRRFGPRCPACKEANGAGGSYASKPMDLRCPTNHHSQHEH